MDSLRIATALVSPWPTWWVEAEDEAGLLEKLESVGPVPQADLFEPWEPGDPWRARVLFPELSEPERLLVHGQLEDGEAPGRTEWRDRGRLGEDEVVAETVRAVCLSDLESGGLLTPDLVRHETDAPDLVQVALALLASVGARGEDDQVTLVQHRSTGRMGLLLEVSVPDREPLAERQALVDGVASVITGEPAAALSPDLHWWFGLQRLHVLAWLVAPFRSFLPESDFVHDDPSGFSGGSGIAVGPDRVSELQVVAGEAASLAIAAELGAAGWQGGRSRWLTVEGERRFVPCWTAPPGTEVPDLDAPHRRVPGCPPGLEGDWLGIDPSWWVSGARVVCRWHCSLRDRDLLPRIEERQGDDVDQALASELARLGSVQPVLAGRPALRVELPGPALAEWASIVEALGALADDRVGSEIWVAFREPITLLLFRSDLPIPEGDPAWEARHW